VVVQWPEWGTAVVRIGFVVEGDCESLLIESPGFRAWAEAQRLIICDPVINARGGGNLCPKQIQSFVNLCQTQANPDKIVVLTDLECDPCVTKTRERIGTGAVDLVCVARKALESWYLADTEALRQWLGQEIQPISSPELTDDSDKPWHYLKKLAKQYQARGPGSNKVLFTRKMLNDYQFSLSRAAAHPDCPSAGYFLEKLKTLSTSMT